MFGEICFISALGLCLLMIIWGRPHRLASHHISRVISILPSLTCALMTGALISLAYAFLTSDFSLLPVTLHSSLSTPWIFKLSATWSHHEGSLLLWLFFMCCVYAYINQQQLPTQIKSYALWSQSCLIFLIGTFTLLSSYPFNHLLYPALDGRDLNPLLQDLSVILHPPLLFSGFAVLSGIFSIVISILLTPTQTNWSRWLLPWAKWATAFLTIGVALGSFWAFYELGWGGWWFWDPVENASLLPWLGSVAFLHSLHLTNTQNTGHRLALFLGLLSFSLCLVGTLLIRSGLITSVHSFAQDPDRGLYLLAVLLIIMGGGFSLFVLNKTKGPSTTSLKAHGLFLQIILFLAAAGTLLFGTLYPSLVALFTDYRLSVGAPYFESTVLPILFPTVLLLGILPFINEDNILPAAHRNRLLAVSVIFGILWLTALYELSFKTIVTYGLLGISAWLAYLTFYRWQTSRPRRHDAALAHLGVAILLAGVAGEYGFHQEWQVTITENAPHSVTPQLTLTLQNSQRSEEANYIAEKAPLLLTKDRTSHVLTLERRSYIPANKTSSETALAFHHLALYTATMSDKLSDGTRLIRFSYHPIVALVWIGALIMASGCIIGRKRKGPSIQMLSTNERQA